LVELELSLVDPPAERLRFGLNEERLTELMLSIGAEGLLAPAGVRAVDGRYQVVWGDHRTEALRRLGWRRAEFFVVRADLDQSVVLSATENLQRHDMSPVEEAAACGRLYEALGQDVDVVARRLKRSRGWVESRLRVLSWPADIQKAVHDGDLSGAAGAELALISDGGHRAFLVSHAVGGGATARTCQAWRIAWEQTGTVSTAAVQQVAPGREPPPPVEAELPCYFCGDREPYGRLTHIWLCPEALEMFAAFRDEYNRGLPGADGQPRERPEAPGGGLRRGA
jgi:ParB family chromosome partitioning protein